MLYSRLNITGLIFKIREKFKVIGFRLIPAFMFISVFLLFIGNIPVSGQLISISARLDTTKIWIGEQTDFTITLDQPADMHVDFPEPGDNLPDKIEIISVFPTDTTIIEDDKFRIIKSCRITSFYEGEHLVETIPFVFSVEGDEKRLHTSQVTLEVLAPEVAPETGIYDIKAPFSISLGFREILPWILLLLLVGLVVWFIIRYLKRSKQEQPELLTSEPVESPHLIAIRELKQLKSDSLWQKGRIKDYYTRLTEIVRIYIERRFGVMAMERTSDEIIAELSLRDGLGNGVIELLRECFSLADLVKFAKARPDEKDHEECLNTAFRFVKTTTHYVFQEEYEKHDETPVTENKELDNR